MAPDAVDAPIYFMTEDQISRGLRTTNRFTGEPFEAVGPPAKVESVIARLDTGADGGAELWKLNRYYDQLAPDGSDAGDGGDGGAPDRVAVGAAQPHRRSRGAHEPRRSPTPAVADRLRALLDVERATKRLTPTLTLPEPVVRPIRPVVAAGLPGSRSGYRSGSVGSGGGLSGGGVDWRASTIQASRLLRNS